MICIGVGKCCPILGTAEKTRLHARSGNAKASITQPLNTQLNFSALCLYGSSGKASHDTHNHHRWPVYLCPVEYHMSESHLSATCLLGSYHIGTMLTVH